ncbi:hypothetical protein B0H14DRAFT_3854486 [Mycena olivaceomarginata]|nr:hypothetical protein B0H14DRAFT_3854486 [Mycena olivaceomarginata]
MYIGLGALDKFRLHPFTITGRALPSADGFLAELETGAGGRPCASAATPPSRRSSKKTKREVTDSSSDELEISDVCRMVKLKPRTPPTSCLGSAQGPPLYLPACLSTRPCLRLAGSP